MGAVGVHKALLMFLCTDEKSGKKACKHGRRPRVPTLFEERGVDIETSMKSKVLARWSETRSKKTVTISIISPDVLGYPSGPHARRGC
eukprot:3051106-Amphidinium_carterae.1